MCRLILEGLDEGAAQQFNGREGETATLFGNLRGELKRV